MEGSFGREREMKLAVGGVGTTVFSLGLVFADLIFFVSLGG